MGHACAILYLDLLMQTLFHLRKRGRKFVHGLFHRLDICNLFQLKKKKKLLLTQYNY